MSNREHGCHQLALNLDNTQNPRKKAKEKRTLALSPDSVNWAFNGFQSRILAQSIAQGRLES